jgi:hypothetical protein
VKLVRQRNSLIEGRVLGDNLRSNQEKSGTTENTEEHREQKRGESTETVSMATIFGAIRRKVEPQRTQRNTESRKEENQQRQSAQKTV